MFKDLEDVTKHYYKETDPLEFISDLYDIMKDGDGLPPDALVRDITGMLRKYLIEHPYISDKLKKGE